MLIVKNTKRNADGTTSVQITSTVTPSKVRSIEKAAELRTA